MSPAPSTGPAQFAASESSRVRRSVRAAPLGSRLVPPDSMVPPGVPSSAGVPSAVSAVTLSDMTSTPSTTAPLPLGWHYATFRHYSTSWHYSTFWHHRESRSSHSSG